MEVEAPQEQGVVLVEHDFNPGELVAAGAMPMEEEQAAPAAAVAAAASSSSPSSAAAATAPAVPAAPVPSPSPFRTKEQGEEQLVEVAQEEDAEVDMAARVIDDVVAFLEKLAMNCEDRCAPQREGRGYSDEEKEEEDEEDEVDKHNGVSGHADGKSKHRGRDQRRGRPPPPTASPSFPTGGPMTAGELSRLYRELLRLREEDGGPGIAACPPEALLALVPYLQVHIKAGSSMNILRRAADVLEGEEEEGREEGLGEWMKATGEGSVYLQQALMSMEAAATALVVMTAPGVDRRLVMQELVEECVGLVKNQVNSHLIPAFDTSSCPVPKGYGGGGGGGGEGGEREGGRKRWGSDSGDEEEEEEEKEEEEEEGEEEEEDDKDGIDEDEEDGDAKKKKKRKKKQRKKPKTKLKSSSSYSNSSHDRWTAFRPVLQQLTRITHKINELLDLLESLVLTIRLEDPFLLTLAPLCLSTLALDAGAASSGGVGGQEGLIKLQPVQHSAISLMQTIFGLYEQHRALIVEDVLGLLLKLPVGKRNLRTFRLHYRAVTLGAEGQNIQMVSALVMLLHQGVVRRPRALFEELGRTGGRTGGRGE